MPDLDKQRAALEAIAREEFDVLRVTLRRSLRVPFDGGPAQVIYVAAIGVNSACRIRTLAMLDKSNEYMTTPGAYLLALGDALEHIAAARPFDVETEGRDEDEDVRGHLEAAHDWTADDFGIFGDTAEDQAKYLAGAHGQEHDNRPQNHKHAAEDRDE